MAWANTSPQGGMSESLQGVAKAAVAGIAIGALTGFLGEAVHGAMELESANGRVRDFAAQAGSATAAKRTIGRRSSTRSIRRRT